MKQSNTCSSAESRSMEHTPLSRRERMQHLSCSSLQLWSIKHTLVSPGVEECNICSSFSEWSNATHARLANVDEQNPSSSLPEWKNATSAHLSTNEAIRHLLMSRISINETHASLSRGETVQHMLIFQRVKQYSECSSLEDGIHDVHVPWKPKLSNTCSSVETRLFEDQCNATRRNHRRYKRCTTCSPLEQWISGIVFVRWRSNRHISWSGIEEWSNFASADFLKWCVNSAHICRDWVVEAHSSVWRSV
jgi:hypothetical protein